MEQKPYFKLKGYLVENDIQFQEVAKLLGITKSSFSAKLNRHGQDFTAEQIRTICKSYKLDANQFFLQ